MSMPDHSNNRMNKSEPAALSENPHPPPMLSQEDEEADTETRAAIASNNTPTSSSSSAGYTGSSSTNDIPPKKKSFHHQQQQNCKARHKPMIKKVLSAQILPPEEHRVQMPHKLSSMPKPPASRPATTESTRANISPTTTAGSGISSMTRTTLLRILFVLSLVVTVVLCTSVAYTVISDLELEIGRQTYESVAMSALEAAQAITMREVKGGEVMESILGNAYPNADQWPTTIGLNGYYETANTVASLSGGNSIALIVLVEPEEAEAFEQHAQEHYQSQGYPDDAGTVEIGFGIRRRDPTAPSGYAFDHEGNHTLYNSSHTILAPVLDHSSWDDPMLMYNVHVSSTAVDCILDCASDPGHNLTNCEIVTGFKMRDDGDLVGIIYKPILPRNDPKQLVGIIGISVNFKDVLFNVVPNHFGGVVAVISTYTKDKFQEDHSTINYDTVTYDIVDGTPRLVGEGDWHNPDYDDYGYSIALNSLDSDAPNTVIYTLTLYPSTFSQFQTNIPVAVSLGFVGVILASTCIFFLYDHLMTRESSEAKLVLDMKRRFVRFISHEIRTPLNTVCMGLELLEDEMQSYLPGIQLEDLMRMKNSQSTSTTTNVASRSKSRVPPPRSEESEMPTEEATIATDRNLPHGTATATVVIDQNDLSNWHEITRDIQENAASAVGILDDLLSYDKVENGTLQLEFGTVRIVDLVEKAVKKFHVQATNKKIELSLDINPCTCNLEECSFRQKLYDAMVVGDEMRLTQVVCNLISNSLKFTPRGGTVKVCLEHLAPKEGKLRGFSSSDCLSDNSSLCDRPWAGSVLVQVTDTGAGMTEEQLSRLFSEGVQFDANKLQAGGGSGLGLCISKGIVDRHSGIISASSEGSGQGSTFSVELPLYDFGEQSELSAIEEEAISCQPGLEFQRGSSFDGFPSYKTANGRTTKEATAFENGNDIVQKDALDGSQKSSTRQGPSSSPATTLSAVEKKSHHILVVEDVASSRKMLIRLLERGGHTCVPACDGQEALEAVLATYRNDLNVDVGDLEEGTNVKHPPFDTVLMDYEMPRLNGPDATAKLRDEYGFEDLIVGVTGNVLSEDVDYFISKGANCVLPKPVSMKLLNDAWKDPNRQQRQRRRKRSMLKKQSSLGCASETSNSSSGVCHRHLAAFSA